MKKKLLAAGIASTLLALGAGVAHAGAHERAEVSIVREYAVGVPRHARESRDSNQYIGCTVRQQGSYGPRVSCFARDASGRSLSCSNSPWGSTYTTHQAEVVSSIGPDSYIVFSVSDGRCQGIAVTNNSSYLDGPATLATAPTYGHVSR